MPDGTPPSARPKRVAWLIFVATLVFVAAAATAVSRGRSEEPAVAPAPPAPPDEFAQIKERVYATIDPEDEKGFERMPVPKAGEWLHMFSERAQPLEKYRLQARVRPTPKRRTIVLQPLGAFTEEQTRLVESMREYAEAFFQLPA